MYNDRKGTHTPLPSHLCCSWKSNFKLVADTGLARYVLEHTGAGAIASEIAISLLNKAVFGPQESPREGLAVNSNTESTDSPQGLSNKKQTIYPTVLLTKSALLLPREYSVLRRFLKNRTAEIFEKPNVTRMQEVSSFASCWKTEDRIKFEPHTHTVPSP
jgi:hypothetical protein